MTREQMDRLKRCLMSVALYDEQIEMITVRLEKTTQMMSETGIRGGGGSPDKFSSMIFARDIYTNLRNKKQQEADSLGAVCELWLHALDDDIADTIRRVELQGEPLLKVAEEKGIPRTTLYDRIQRQYDKEVKNGV